MGGGGGSSDTRMKASNIDAWTESGTWEERCLSTETLSEDAEGKEQKELLLGPIRFDLETALARSFGEGVSSGATTTSWISF